MTNPAYRGLLLALYQMSILTGILLFPVALLARQAGVRLPVDRLIQHLGAAYEDASPN